MEQNKYTRDTIISRMLKLVIIRIDFSGSTGITRFVDNIKQLPLIQDAFNTMYPIGKHEEKFTLKFRNPEEGILPFREVQNSTIYRFSDCLIDKNKDTYLDITNDALCLYIDCQQNYQGSKAFTLFMSKLLLALLQTDGYIKINRIGIRKIDAQTFDNADELSNFFNENFTAAHSWSNDLPKDKVNLVELLKIKNINFNITQQIEKLNQLQNRAIFDIDSFIMSDAINQYLKDEDSLFNFLYHDMQDQMFELFKRVVSDQYLEKSLKKEQ